MFQSNLDLSPRPRQQDLATVGELGPGDEDDVPDSSGCNSHFFFLAPPTPFCVEEGGDGVVDDGVGW